MIRQVSAKTNLTEVNNMKFLFVVSKHLSHKLCLVGGILFFLVSASVPAIAAEENSEPAVKVFDRIIEENEDDVLEGDATNIDTDEDDESKTEENDTRTTAEKLEDLKQDVLDVNRDLFILEEDLLFPASTQLAAYFSVDIGYFFALDNIKIKIDDEQVAHHLYTVKDVDALYRGAIQKLHLNNISTGEHELVAILIGKGPRKRDYRIAVSFKFEKGVDAQALEIQLRDDTGKLQPKLKVVEW